MHISNQKHIFMCICIYIFIDNLRRSNTASSRNQGMIRQSGQKMRKPDQNDFCFDLRSLIQEDLTRAKRAHLRARRDLAQIFAICDLIPSAQGAFRACAIYVDSVVLQINILKLNKGGSSRASPDHV